MSQTSGVTRTCAMGMQRVVCTHQGGIWTGSTVSLSKRCHYCIGQGPVTLRRGGETPTSSINRSYSICRLPGICTATVIIWSGKPAFQWIDSVVSIDYSHRARRQSMRQLVCVRPRDNLILSSCSIHASRLVVGFLPYAQSRKRPFSLGGSCLARGRGPDDSIALGIIMCGRSCVSYISWPTP